MPSRQNTSIDPPAVRRLDKARQNFALRLVELREEAGISQREAARRAGLDQRNWGRMEKQKTNPRLDSLLRIQHAFGLDSMEALLGRLPAQELLEDES